MVPIAGGMIELGALLKLASRVQSGGEAKALIQAGRVAVNGVVETRRHRQVRSGDTVTLTDGTEIVVAARGTR